MLRVLIVVYSMPQSLIFKLVTLRKVWVRHARSNIFELVRIRV